MTLSYSYRHILYYTLYVAYLFTLLLSHTSCRSLAEVQSTMGEATHAMVTCISDKFAINTLRELNTMFIGLRQLNVVNPKLPTIALVGAPNVGKSSLVRVLSSGKPEIQNYPFTTKSISVGHLMIDGPDHPFLCQVTDTPGLLNRPDHERKKMEMLTLSVLEHIPRLIVVFVIDPSGHCGTSLEDQLLIRQELRWRYHNLIPGHRWVDVATKTDIWRKSPEELAESERLAEIQLERDMVKMQAKRLGISIEEVIMQMKAVELNEDHNRMISKQWEEQYLNGTQLLNTHGDWVVCADEGVIKNGNGDVVMTVNEFREQQLQQGQGQGQVTSASQSGDVGVDVYEESDGEYIDTTVDNNDNDDDDDQPDTPNSTTTNTKANKVNTKYHKPTTTATPSTPSSLSVDHTWSLASAITALPPRPAHFIDDNCHCCEISVASEDAYVEAKQDQAKHDELMLKRMFGIVDEEDIERERASKLQSQGVNKKQQRLLVQELCETLNDEGESNETADADADVDVTEEQVDIENSSRSIEDDDDDEVDNTRQHSQHFAPRDDVHYIKPVVDDIVGLGLHEVKVDAHIHQDMQKVIEETKKMMESEEIDMTSEVSPALIHGQQGLDDLQGLLAWELLSMCENIDPDADFK